MQFLTEINQYEGPDPFAANLLPKVPTGKHSLPKENQAAHGRMGDLSLGQRIFLTLNVPMFIIYT